MANKYHVDRIKQRGVENWNIWRNQRIDIMPDFLGADLRGANLGGAILSAALFDDANLRGADLHGADLQLAFLRGVDLQDADLHGADLRGADLGSSNLRGANINGANLESAELVNTLLDTADLRDVNLYNANLHGAQFNNANLCNADLRMARLINSRLDGADLTGSKLWEAQRGRWSIKGIICKHAFWDEDSTEETKYKDGAFERIFAEKPRIELRYPSGGPELIDFAMLPLIVEQVQARHTGCALHIRSVQDVGSGATVTITVEDLANRDSGSFQQEVEELQNELKYIQGQRDLLVDQFMPIFRELATKGGQTIIGQMTNFSMIGSSMSRDTFNTGQAGAVGPNAHAHDMTFQQVQNQSSIDLTRLADELKQLRTAMKKADDKDEQDEAIGAVAAAEKTAAKGDGPATLRHLKAASKWTLGIAEKIGVSVAAEAIKRAM